MANEQAGNGRSAGAGEPGGPGVHQSASARDHGVTHQAAGDQTINNNYYYGAPPRPDAPPAPPSAPPGGGRGSRGTVLAVAGAAVGAVVLAVVLSNLATSGGEHGSDDGPTPGPTTGTPTTAAPTTPPPSEHPTSPAPGTVRWKGPLRLDSSDASTSKEMDTDTPTVVDDNDPGADLWFWHDMDGRLKTANHAVVAEWTGGGLPTAQQCADIVGGAGTGELPLKTGNVICLQTSDHRIGRLKVTKFWYDVGDGGATFDAVVWEKG